LERSDFFDLEASVLTLTNRYFVPCQGVARDPLAAKNVEKSAVVVYNQSPAAFNHCEENHVERPLGKQFSDRRFGVILAAWRLGRSDVEICREAEAHADNLRLLPHH